MCAIAVALGDDVRDRSEGIRELAHHGFGGGAYIRQATAQEMYDWGLVNKIVPDGQHVEEAKKLAQEVAKQAPIAARFIKEAILKAFEVPLEDGLLYEKRLFALLFSSEDQKEGMRAFLAKEPPKFQGR